MRYVAFVWNRDSESQRESAQFLIGQLLGNSPRGEWQRSLDQDGCVVFNTRQLTRAKDRYLLDGNSGVVLGALFKRSRILTDASICPRARLGPRESESIVANGGRELVTDYWGNYVAFVTDEKAGKVWAIRGPRSSLTLYQAQYENVAVYFADVEDVLRLGVFSFSFDFKQIATFMVHDGGTEKTSLKEVTEVIPGQRVEWHRGKASRDFPWHPLDFTTRQLEIRTIDEALGALRAVIISCTQTWASCYDELLLSLSGGVDSSIILAALNRTAARVKCFTHYSDERIEDERPLARAAARKANRELIEILRPSNVRYEDAMDAKLTVHPGSYLAALLTRMGNFIPESEHSAEAILTGNHGDETLFRHQPQYGIEDRLYRHGPFKGLKIEATRAAIKDGRLVWKILGQACYNAWIPHQISFTAPAFQNTRLMNEEVLQEIERSKACESIWFKSTRDAPPGKLYHMYVMLQRFGTGTVIESAWKPDSVSPFRSQPVTELALRIPSHFFWLDGKERGLALKAFEDGLTHETLTRTWKGGITSHHTDLIRNNIEFIRALFEDCPLIDEGILDGDKVRQSLSDALNGAAAHAVEVLGVADLAVYLSLWKNRGYLRRPSSVSRPYSRPNLAEIEIQ